MQKYDENTDISIYLAMFERQARAADVDEREWASQLMALLPLELAQILIKEPEDMCRDYNHVKLVLLERFKRKPETFRVKFTQHQRKTGSLWKELVFELRNYLEGWLEGVKITDFESLKNLMVCDQIKRRVSADIKEHFIDEWGNLSDPCILANKLDAYEAVRQNLKKPNSHKVGKKRDRQE